jgi:hypothetical protein
MLGGEHSREAQNFGRKTSEASEGSKGGGAK